MGRRSPQSALKRAREQALREKRELKQAKKDARAEARRSDEADSPVEGMHPVHLVLRELRDEDLPVLYEQWTDPVAAQTAAFTPPDHVDREAFERRWARLRSDETVISRTIVADGEVVGTISSWDSGDDREVTYWIGREYWGRGIATSALEAFSRVDTTRPLHARVAADNVASRRVLEKCGFRVVGTDRGFAAARGEEIDELVLRLDAAPAGPQDD